MYCKYCGEKVSENSKFCNKCGKNIEDKPITPNTNENPGKGRAIASLVLGILSIIFGGIFIPIPIIGLIMGCSYKGKCSEKTAGIILNTIGLIFSIITTILLVFFLSFVGKSIINEIDNFDIDQIGEWEEYSKYVVETDVLDSTSTLVGNWKELSVNRSYFVFDNEGHYYYYSDINDMEKNYISGNFKVLDDVSNFEEVKTGIEIVNNYLNKILDIANSSNLHFFKLTPTKIVKDGVVVPKGKDYDEIEGMYLISIHDQAVELTLGYEFEDAEGEIKHFYKIVE